MSRHLERLEYHPLQEETLYLPLALWDRFHLLKEEETSYLPLASWGHSHLLKEEETSYLPLASWGHSHLLKKEERMSPPMTKHRVPSYLQDNDCP
jgi:hypothetical protein